jgi:thiosulfate/3-mercaptopyruvate sulfurtransferase
MTFTTLVSCAELAQHLDDPRWVVVDCRHQLNDPDWGERSYREAHLAGARFLHLDRDLSSPLTGNNGRHPLPDPARLAQRLRDIGLNADSQLVVYDHVGGGMAARLWWLARWLGHSQVALLDGGFGAWTAAGLPVDDHQPDITPGNFSGTPNPAWTVDAAYLLGQLDQASLRLIDARAADRFAGENETLDPVGGHIPGARNRPWMNNLAADGRFKPAAQLREEWLAVLAGSAAADSIQQCGSGVTACHNLLALEVAGLSGARLYPGSWSEWCSDPARPVARGV